MPGSSRCELCGAPISPAESLASRYACLTSCIPLIKSEHLSSLHKDYLAESRRAGRLLVYPALLLAVLSAILAYASQPAYLIVPPLISSLALLAAGTYIRLRLISLYRETRDASSRGPEEEEEEGGQ